MTGPVSTLLEQEVAGELRRHGIVVWLDKDASYTRFVDELAARHAKGEVAFPVVGFRGSFLELLFALEDFGSGLDKQQLLVHMPGYNEESIRQTPVLELYDAGSRFRKALDTLVREAATARVAPAEVDAFVAKQASLEDADLWLSSAVTESSFGLAAALAEFGPRMLAEALADPAALSARVTAPEEVATLRGYVHKLTGMDDAWAAFYPGEAEARPLDRVLHQLAAWALSVEYVHDLRRPPHLEALRRLRDLSAPLVKACGDLVAKLRKDSGDAYARLADEVEGVLAKELEAIAPEDLGQIDTFREEENRVLKGAVAALRSGAWGKARAWADARQGERSFWLSRDQLRRWAWNLVTEAAELGETIARHPRPFAGARSLDEATERYAAGAFEVDRAHRRFEQRRLALLDSRLPHYGDLREVATELRRAHRAWADELARDFAALCSEHGFLPSAEHRQRNLYEQVVHPLTLASEKVAVFLIDAFRYEMATELVDELSGAGTAVDLKARLAELPTITSVGMNALAPVANGERMAVSGVFAGFRSNEFTVATPETRARSMGVRSAGRPVPMMQLAEVCDASTADLVKRVKPHPLIVVCSREIDDAGEANVGLPTFESTLRQIKAAWHHLQLAGVKQCVFTADHGFLLLDETTETKRYKPTRNTPRRHILDEHARGEPGMVNVSVSSLGYEGVSGYLLFREDTAVFETSSAGASFVHGGNSPQERVIPVLTVTRKRAEQGGYSEYAVEVEPQADERGLHQLRLRVGFEKQTTTSLGFAAPGAVGLALRAQRDGVRVVVKDVTGAAAEAFRATQRLEVPVVDAWTTVFFTLEGPTDERVRVEVHHPDGVERVKKVSPEQWYSVRGTATVIVAPKTPPVPPASPPLPAPAAPVKRSAPPPADWSSAIADEGIRKVFLHIEKHGVVTEPEVTKILGSPRAFRRFSLEFELHLPKLPFRVRIDTGDGGKRYVREGDR